MPRSQTALILFTRAPIPGRCKTRLKPKFGARGAARIQAQLINKRLGDLPTENCELIIAAADRLQHPVFWQAHRHQRSPDTQLARQSGKSLGQRMGRLSKHYAGRYEQLILIGTDCPALDSKTINQAIKSLSRHDAVMIPAEDGGYVLLGLRRYHPLLFSLPGWGNSQVAQRTLQRLRRLNWSVDVQTPLPDLDRPADWRQARRTKTVGPVWTVSAR